MPRLARPDDAEHVTRLIEGFMDHESYAARPSHDVVLRSVQRLLADPQTEFLLAGDPPAGVAQLRYRWSVWTESEDAWLEDLFVTAEARGSGLGRALVEAAVERARARGCARIELDTAEDNPARRLYEALGFIRKGGNGIYMQKRL
jgi:GNAT superfamily N-acetyltransferase